MEFEAHIYPEKDKLVSLKYEQFNRLALTCVVAIYHFDDGVSFFGQVSTCNHSAGLHRPFSH